MFARFLTDQLAPKTAMEFGCGVGLLSDFVARQANADVTCIEPETTLDTLLASNKRDGVRDGVVPKGRLRQLVLNPFNPDKKTAKCSRSVTDHGYDLVISLEVAEHIPHHFHKTMADLIGLSVRKWLVFSAATQGRKEDGHLADSLLSPDQWKDIFAMRGLVYMPLLTQMAREAASRVRDDLSKSRSLMVFKHVDYPANDTDIPVEMLRGILRKNTSHEKAEGFADGVSSLTWPSLVAMQQQAENDELCYSAESRELAARRLAEQRGNYTLKSEVLAQQQQQQTPTSAWAAWGAVNSNTIGR